MSHEGNSSKVSLSFASKSKKVSSSLNLRQKSIIRHRDEEAFTAQNVTNNTDDLFTVPKEEELVIPLIKQNRWRSVRAPTEQPPPLESENASPTTTKSKAPDPGDAETEQQRQE